MLNYFIYLSLAKDAMTETELTSLIEKSQNYNSQNDLTGLLMYKGPLSDVGDAYFMQLLEGPHTQLERLKAKIKSDPRHVNFVTLDEGQIASRTFPKWSMGLRHVDEEKLSRVEGYANLDSKEFWTSAQNGTLDNSLGVMQFFSEEDV